MKISIIVPNYNSPFLKECVFSLLNQVYNNYEILIIDDGSNDEYKKIYNNDLFSNSNIRIFKKTNGGVSSARNFGISKAQGDFLVFVDSDDFVSKSFLSNLVKNLKDDIDLIALGLKNYDNNTKFSYLINQNTQKKIYSNEQIRKIIVDDGKLNGFLIQSSCSVLYRRSVIIKNKVFFNENVKFNEDGLFNCEYVMNSLNKVLIDFTNSDYFYRSYAISSSKSVNESSEVYFQSMQYINLSLIKYGKDSKNEIYQQILRRNFSKLLLTLISISKKKFDYNVFLSMIKHYYNYKSFKYIKFNKLNTKKRIFIILLYLKQFKIMYYIFKLNQYE
jgi:glycosyltransferase involved in cell wall biosynthesis